MLFAQQPSPDGTAALITAVALLVTALTGLFAIVGKLWQRDNVTDRRVDLLWEAQARRGRIELEKQQGSIISTSTGASPMPERLRDDLKRAFAPIIPALRQTVATIGAGATPGRIAEAIEAAYGDWIAVHICRVLGVNNYECLEMARLVACEMPPPAAA